MDLLYCPYAKTKGDLYQTYRLSAERVALAEGYETAMQ